MKKYLFLLVVLGLAGLHYQTAEAHVLLRDPQTKIGAILHINPDDDPIAGEGEFTQLYFDIQDKNAQTRLPLAAYQLTIIDEAGTSNYVHLEEAGSTLIATYTFPSQGLYRLELRSTPDYDSFLKVSMQDSLRVSRGTITNTPTGQKHPLAGIIAFVAANVFVVLAIVAFNYRQKIARHSIF